MEPGHGQAPRTSPPTLWPVGLALGVAVILVGLIASPTVIAPIGAVIAVVFGYLWVRDLGAEYRGVPEAIEPERRAAPAERPAPAIPANEGEAAMPQPESEEEIDRFPRSRFLEGATLGLGGVIGGLLTVPALGFAIVPAFTGQHTHTADIGPLSDYPEGKYVIATFMLDPQAGEISRRTAYVRNNGLLNGQPSFTILSNRCAHLGCPVQANGPALGQAQRVHTKTGDVDLTPILPAGFGCPCHGGQYDPEGNRVAGPPVRALDRYEYSIRNGHLWLGRTYSVSHVDGAGKSARIHKYGLAGPGQHITGIESWLYPLQPPH